MKSVKWKKVGDKHPLRDDVVVILLQDPFQHLSLASRVCSVVLAEEFEVIPGVGAGGAILRRLLPIVDVAVVAAPPPDWLLSLEYPNRLDVHQQVQVTLLVLLLGDGYGPEDTSDLVKALLDVGLGEVGVYGGVLVVLPHGRGPRVGRGVPDDPRRVGYGYFDLSSSEELEQPLGVPLVQRGLLEYL